MAAVIIRLLSVPDVPEGHTVELEVDFPEVQYRRVRDGEAKVESVGPFEENGPTYVFHGLDLSGDEMVIEMVAKPH
jgi:hypothetical protein